MYKMSRKPALITAYLAYDTTNRTSKTVAKAEATTWRWTLREPRVVIESSDADDECWEYAEVLERPRYYTDQDAKRAVRQAIGAVDYERQGEHGPMVAVPMVTLAMGLI